MSAVVAVMNESVTEGLKGFYKLRRAYVILEGIVERESSYLGNRNGISSVDAQSSSLAPGTAKVNGIDTDVSAQHLNTQSAVPQEVESATPIKQEDASSRPGEDQKEKSGDADDYQDAEEGREGAVLSEQTGSLEMNAEIGKVDTHLSAEAHMSSLPQSPAVGGFYSYFTRTPSRIPIRRTISHDPDSDIFAHPIDIFVHSGAATCFGILLVFLSLVPPVFGRLLSIIGFNGDRERGLRMLWQASKFHNVNGALAGLVLLGFYNTIGGLSDIAPDYSPSLPEDAVENLTCYPVERLERLLQAMQKRYPKSKLWKLEAGRMAANRKDLDAGIKILSGDLESPLKQVKALSVFEKSLQSMFSHRYALCAESFKECTKLNNWSHALYLYVAGCANVELYRQSKLKGAPEAETSELAKEATKCLLESRTNVGKKKFLARQLPFDVFVMRKVNKWEARSKEWDVSLVDAVGVSPLEEMAHFWNGFKKMSHKDVEESIKCLSWNDNLEQNPQWAKEDAEEKAILCTLRAIAYRAMGEHGKAKELLQKEILPQDRSLFKGPLKDDWMLPTAHYEMAANLWQERDRGADEGTERNRKLVGEADDWLSKASKWERYTLDARLGMRITTGLDTFKTWKAKHSD